MCELSDPDFRCKSFVSPPFGFYPDDKHICSSWLHEPALILTMKMTMVSFWTVCNVDLLIGRLIMIMLMLMMLIMILMGVMVVMMLMRQMMRMMMMMIVTMKENATC